MILGIGNDIVDIRRIERLLTTYGNRFRERTFTKTEQKKAARAGRLEACSLAKRFAAKEAMSKALGTGFSNGVTPRSIGVVNLPSGRPTIELTGEAQRILTRMSGNEEGTKVWLTLTDDFPYAQAVVVIEQ